MWKGRGVGLVVMGRVMIEDRERGREGGRGEGETRRLGEEEMGRLGDGATRGRGEGEQGNRVGTRGEGGAIRWLAAAGSNLIVVEAVTIQ